MSSMYFRLLLSGCTAIGCGLAQLTAGQTVSTPVDNRDSGLEEIVVTANKREENLNKLGLTVTAISRDELEAKRITSLQDLAAAVPGLSFAPSANNTPILTLRGVGFNESSLGVYPAVSVYVDQAPLPFPVLASHAAFDLQRIEVLKGPQGTLFGQNSTGGAINYIAAKPTKDFEAGGDITFGRFNQSEGSAYVSGEVAENMRARLAVTGENMDGWQISDTRPYDRNGKQSYVAARLLLDWDPIETLHLSFSLNGWDDSSQPQAAQFILLQPQTAADTHPQELATPFTAGDPRSADWDTGIRTPRSSREFIQPALRADVDLPYDLTLTSLTSYDHYLQHQTTDGDGSALAVTDLQEDKGYIHSFNQEVRLANSSTSALRWLVGGNFEQSSTFERQLLAYEDNSSDTPSKDFLFQNYQQGHQNIRNYAGFASAEFDITPDLTFRSAARYTDTRNRADICGFDVGDGHIASFFNLLGNILGTGPFAPIGSTGPEEQRCFSLNQNNVPSGTPYIHTLQQDNVSWRVGLDYRIDPNMLVYGNVSRGYKAGSFPILAAATISQFNPVTQESLTDYEGGFKWSFWERKAQLNAAAFYYEYKDKQVLTKEIDPVFGILDVLKNVPKSRLIGFETDFNVKPFTGMTLSSSFTYLDSRIQDYNGVDYAGTPRNFAGDPLPFAPKWSASIGAEYRFQTVGGGNPFLGISASGHTMSDTVPGGSSIGVAAAPTTRLLPGLTYPFTTNGYATVDANIGYEAASSRWKTTLWAKNVLNKYYWTNVVTASDFSARYAGLPATFGITFSYSLK